jgi:site-specific recombinase XerD
MLPPPSLSPAASKNVVVKFDGRPLSSAVGQLVPALIAAEGEAAALRFLDFFTANIRNPNTRAAYAVAVRAFFAWLDSKHVAPLGAVRTHHVSALCRSSGPPRYRAPTVKQHLAAIRMLFDYLVVGQILAINPAHAVRGPKHSVKRGKTPVLSAAQARELLDSIDVSTVVGLRDRALIALMTFSFARVSAAVGMRVEDYFPKGKRWWVRLHEKGGQRHEMPAHHNLEHYLDAYIEAAKIRDAGKGSPVPFRRRPHRRADRNADAPRRRLAHGPAPRGRSRHAGECRLPHLPRHGHHGISRSRRHPRKRPGDGRPRQPAHDAAL